MTTSSKPPFPPFTMETATEKVRLAEDAWNTRDPERVSLAYTVDSRWRNRAEFVTGRDQIVALILLIASISVGCNQTTAPSANREQQYSQIAADFTQRLADVKSIMGEEGRTLSEDEWKDYAVGEVAFPMNYPVVMEQHNGQSVAVPDSKGSKPYVVCWGDTDNHVVVVAVGDYVVGKAIKSR